MAREAFQSESISEHIDNWEFDTKIPGAAQDKSEGGRITEITFEKLQTFWSIEKASAVVILASAVVWWTRSVYC